MIALDQRTILQEELLDQQGWKKAVALVSDEYVELYCAMQKKIQDEIEAQAPTGITEETELQEPISNSHQRLVLNLGDSPEARFALTNDVDDLGVVNLTEEDYRVIDETDAKTEFAVAFNHWQRWEPE